VHLSGVSVSERAELQIDDDQTAQTPMEEEEINTISGIANSQATLTRDEGETVAEFE
jgi:hypothetical protein